MSLTSTIISEQDGPAIFSSDRRYRYLLRRRVGLGDQRCAFVMLNPSTADEVVNDPTVTRCIRFAQVWGYGILEVVNIFAYRATDPKELYTYRDASELLRVNEAFDPIGVDNDHFIVTAASQCHQVVVAWGNHGALYDRGAEVLSEIWFAKHRIYSFGMTQAGQPRHPLYLPKDQPLIPIMDSVPALQ